MRLDDSPKNDRIRRFSPKKKWVLMLCFLFGFMIGLHALYTGRIKKGIFYLFSLAGVFLYYSYILYVLSHGQWTSWLHFNLMTWYALYISFASVLQHIPFLGWTAFFSSYLIYLFIFALFLAFLDFFSILFGFFKDAAGLPVVSERYKKRHSNDLVAY